MSSIEEALRSGAQAIADQTDNPQLEAQLLLAFTLEKERAYLYGWPEQALTDLQQSRFLNLLERRQAGEPLAYLTGYKEFWSLPLNITPDVLIPRPETEQLVQLALDLLPQEQCLVADLGTGSGAIALALASERPQWQLTAIDQSSAALQVAEENSRLLGLTTQIEFRLGSWCDPLSSPQHAIISNPPYIAADDPHLHQHGLSFEPASALASGADGLDDIRQISETANACLQADGLLLLEHGYQQQSEVISILKSSGYREIRGYRDDQGQDRFVVASCST